MLKKYPVKLKVPIDFNIIKKLNEVNSKFSYFKKMITIFSFSFLTIRGGEKKEGRAVKTGATNLINRSRPEAKLVYKPYSLSENH